MIALAPSPFEQWAASRGYDTARAVSPCELRSYANSHTQDAFNAWNGGEQNLARMLTESTLETEALRERIKAIAVSE
jgi:hypothetical protein